MSEIIKQSDEPNEQSKSPESSLKNLNKLSSQEQSSEKIIEELNNLKEFVNTPDLFAKIPNNFKLRVKNEVANFDLFLKSQLLRKPYEEVIANLKEFNIILDSFKTEQNTNNIRVRLELYFQKKDKEINQLREYSHNKSIEIRLKEIDKDIQNLLKEKAQLETKRHKN